MGELTTLCRPPFECVPVGIEGRATPRSKEEINSDIENSAISRNGSEASVREPVRVCMGGLNHPTPAPN